MPVQRSLDLYMISDSGRASACTNFGIFFRFSRFSPFAEEGFTCLDHSAMSKKKIFDTILVLRVPPPFVLAKLFGSLRCDQSSDYHASDLCRNPRKPLKTHHFIQETLRNPHNTAHIHFSLHLLSPFQCFSILFSPPSFTQITCLLSVPCPLHSLFLFQSLLTYFSPISPSPPPPFLSVLLSFHFFHNLFSNFNHILPFA